MKAREEYRNEQETLDKQWDKGLSDSLHDNLSNYLFACMRANGYTQGSVCLELHRRGIGSAAADAFDPACFVAIH
jgi:hypothetical protein